MTNLYRRQAKSDGAGRDIPGAGLEGVVRNPRLELMDQVREVLRFRHYSSRTERGYCDWIRRYIKFHRMQSQADLHGAEAEIEAFLSRSARSKDARRD